MSTLNVVETEDRIALSQRTKYKPDRVLNAVISIATQPTLALESDGEIDPDIRSGPERAFPMSAMDDVVAEIDAEMDEPEEVVDVRVEDDESVSV